MKDKSLYNGINGHPIVGTEDDPNRYIQNSAIKDLQKRMNQKVPIRRGCPASQCFCTGKCKEIIGWRDKIAGEY